MEKRTEKLAWYWVLGSLVCIALWPLWSSRFPPMQDYPTHLLQAQMLRAYNDPAFDYNNYFQFQLSPSYAAFFLTTYFFSLFAPIEIAGKLSLSLYVILVAVVALRLGRRFENHVPWGALLFFPISFNQQYFLGNVNYLLSLPVLVLVILDYDDLLHDELGAWPILRHFLWQAMLVLTHPFSYLVYIALFVVMAFVDRQTLVFRAKFLIPMGTALLLLVTSYILSATMTTPSDLTADAVNWISPIVPFVFFCLLFTGMGGTNGAVLVTLVLWLAIIFVVTVAMVDHRRERGSLPLPYILLIATVSVGFFVLPFDIGAYTYINLRVAAIIYFLMVLLAAHVRFRGWHRVLLIIVVGLCMIDSSVKQRMISEEISEITPIVYSIPSNSRILPLVFDNTSQKLDNRFFPVHLHDHNYYHILVGGGFNPYLPVKASVNPVRYKEDAERPSPGEGKAANFSWQLHSADYNYFLVRGAPKAFLHGLEEHCREIAVSGKWALFERRAKTESSR